MPSRRHAVSVLAYTVGHLALAGAAAAQQPSSGDVPDQFFRYTEKEHKAFFAGIPGETIDPFTGTLRIVQQDLALPGRGGHDLVIVRSYSSKIWGRADLLDMEPLLAEKEQSVLGYGWTFHMGRVKNPFASGESGICSGDFPVYESPDGTARVFYPLVGSNAVFVSKDYWRLEKQCPALGGAGVCIWSDTGSRYEFSAENQYYYGGTVPVWPASAIVDPHENRITIQYLPQSGAVGAITDTYNRLIEFGYTSDEDGLRLSTVNANGNVYTYLYTPYGPSDRGAGLALPGVRRFLTEVRPPVGPSYLYAYAYSSPVSLNQYALESITDPGGATITYGYSPVYFFTGRDTVPFPVVTRRTVSGRGVPTGEWSYSYNSPGPGSELQTTTITRPDGRTDTYAMVGFGYVAGMSNGTTRYTYAVGLVAEIARGDRAQVEEYWWSPNKIPPVSSAVYSAPVYGSSCGPYYVWDDVVYSPALTKRQIWRDGALYTTDYSEFDEYGQARTVNEVALQGAYINSQQLPGGSRQTTWTFFSAPVNPGDGSTLNMVRGRPLSQTVCIGAECSSDTWTYSSAYGFAVDSQTVSGVKTSFTYEPSGNLATVSNALGQTLAVGGYDAGYGTPTQLTLNGVYSISRTATWEGWVLSETNGRSHTTSFTYDAIGRLETVTPPGIGNMTRYSYAADGSWVREARGSYFKNSYLDGMGRTTSTSDSEGVRTSTFFDTLDRPWFTSYSWNDAKGEMGEKREFDGLGRVVGLTSAYRPTLDACDAPGACAVTMEYSSNCVGTTVQRGGGVAPKTWRCYTSFGDPEEQRLTQVLDAKGELWQYPYNAVGRLTGVIAPVAPGARAYSYDEKQFLRIETSGETGQIGYVRNDIGLITTRPDARGVTASYAYDALSRVRTIAYRGGSPESVADDVTQDHDNANNVTYVSSTNGGTFENTYDEVNRVTSQTWTLDNIAYVTSYRYDASGCLYSMTYPTGLELELTCDSSNRVTSISAGGAGIVRGVAYHPSGAVEGLTFGNGRSTVATYDDRARSKSVSTPGVVTLGYEYDGADNVVSLCRDPGDSACLSAATSPYWTRTMSYDSLDRLYSAIEPNQWGTAVYDYDALGNRTLKSVGSYTTTYLYDEQNRIASSTGRPPLAKSMTLTWDQPGRLASSSDGASYRYDGHGRRVRKTDASGTTVYHYDKDGRVIAETTANGAKLRDYSSLRRDWITQVHHESACLT